MVRWQPAARDRLAKAALELFTSRGFDVTTVADIAAEAGLTERTFYRYFADKREVLFGGQGEFQHAFIDVVRSADADAPPLEIVRAAVDAVCSSGMFSAERRSYSRLRQTIIAANPELRERDLYKMSSLSGALAEALRERGIDEPDASLAAESGVVVFRLSFATWLADDSDRSLADIERETFGALRALSA